MECSAGGLTDAVAALFRDVRWSDPHALSDTRANVPGHLPVAEVATLPDIDTAQDLKRWRACP